MIIIGENINGAIPKVSEAIKNKDTGYIQNLARQQVDCGASYIDVCAGTKEDEEYDVLCWLIENVEKVTQIPISIDSPNSEIIKRIVPKIKNIGIINSVSGEVNKSENLFPLVKEIKCNVIALTSDDKGIPSEANKKIQIAANLIEKAEKCGISQEQIFIDPLVLSLSVANDTLKNFQTTIEGIRNLYPNIQIVLAISNISFGMPYRKIINRCFLAIALSNGIDAAIIDSTDRDNIATIFATNALLGNDKYCRKYYNAYREGKFGEFKRMLQK